METSSDSLTSTLISIDDGSNSTDLIDESSSIHFQSFILPFQTAVKTVDLHLDSSLSQKKDILQLLSLFVLMISLASTFGLQYTVIAASGQPEQIFFGYNRSIYLRLPAALFVAYSFICASRLSIISDEWTVFRFTYDQPISDGTGSSHLSTLAKHSYWSIITSYISINWYLMGVAVVLYGVNRSLDHLAGPLPPTFVSVLYPILYLGGFFLYTSQIFDIYTNVMLIVCLLHMSYVKDTDSWGSTIALWLPIAFYGCLTLPSPPRSARTPLYDLSPAGSDSIPEARTESDLESNGMFKHPLSYHTVFSLSLAAACLPACLCFTLVQSYPVCLPVYQSIFVPAFLPPCHHACLFPLALDRFLPYLPAYLPACLTSMLISCLSVPFFPEHS
jgi:hypothetical protein